MRGLSAIEPLITFRLTHAALVLEAFWAHNSGKDYATNSISEISVFRYK